MNVSTVTENATRIEALPMTATTTMRVESWTACLLSLLVVVVAAFLPEISSYVLRRWNELSRHLREKRKRIARDVKPVTEFRKSKKPYYRRSSSTLKKARFSDNICNSSATTCATPLSISTSSDETQSHTQEQCSQASTAPQQTYDSIHDDPTVVTSPSKSTEQSSIEGTMLDHGMPPGYLNDDSSFPTSLPCSGSTESALETVEESKVVSSSATVLEEALPKRSIDAQVAQQVSQRVRDRLLPHRRRLAPGGSVASASVLSTTSSSMMSGSGNRRLRRRGSSLSMQQHRLSVSSSTSEQRLLRRTVSSPMERPEFHRHSSTNALPTRKTTELIRRQLTTSDAD